jgi:gas vesicle protein
MTSDPSVIRAQIEQTRANLSDDVDALADQANPAHIAHRQVAKAKRAGGRLLDRILGTAEDVRDAAADKAHELAADVGDATGDVTGRAPQWGHGVADLPNQAGRQAQGNPVAAGVVAFGIGLLIAAAFPASRKEQELAQAVKEQAQPLTDQVTAAAREVADNLAGPAKEAVENLKESAGEAVAAVQEEGSAAVSDVQGVVSDAAAEVADTARDSAEEVKDEARRAAGS